MADGPTLRPKRTVQQRLPCPEMKLKWKYVLLQLALSTANGVSGGVDQARRDFSQPADTHQMASLGQYWIGKVILLFSIASLWLCCCCHRLAAKGRSVAPWWPQLIARLQRSAGGRLLSFRIWSTHLLRGRPGRRCHWLFGGRPRDSCLLYTSPSPRD